MFDLIINKGYLSLSKNSLSNTKINSARIINAATLDSGFNVYVCRDDNQNKIFYVIFFKLKNENITKMFYMMSEKSYINFEDIYNMKSSEERILNSVTIYY